MRQLYNSQVDVWHVTVESSEILKYSAFLPPFLSIPEIPPKKCRGAKAGAILSGISHAVPGEADIGSRVPQDVSNLSRNHGELLQCPSATLSNMLGMYCHTCCNAIQSEFQQKCIDCHVLICEQFVLRRSGCIVHGSVVCSREEFMGEWNVQVFAGQTKFTTLQGCCWKVSKNLTLEISMLTWTVGRLCYIRKSPKRFWRSYSRQSCKILDCWAQLRRFRPSGWLEAPNFMLFMAQFMFIKVAFGVS